MTTTDKREAESASGGGADDAVVLLHSGGMSSRQWRKLADRLAPTHRVIAPDFLGSGANPPWPEGAPFHFDDDVAAVERRLADVTGRVHLVGHSYGGLVALMLARRDPARVRSLAAYDPVAFGVLYAAHDAAGLADAARTTDLLDEGIGGTDRWFELFVDYWSGPGAWRALAEGARQSFLKVGHKVFREVVSLVNDRTAAPAYAGIAAPVLLLTGEHTPVAEKRVVAILAEALPSATRVEVAGAGHMGPLTHADAVNDLIADHIARA
jgi:pimeloyl-ACP methyl ester carboxylesterase